MSWRCFYFINEYYVAYESVDVLSDYQNLSQSKFQLTQSFIEHLIILSSIWLICLLALDFSLYKQNASVIG